MGSLAEIPRLAATATHALTNWGFPVEVAFLEDGGMPWASLLLLALLPLSAKEGEHLSLHAQAGSGGVGFGITGPLAGPVTWRAEINAMDVTGSRTTEGVDFDYKARFRDVGLLADWQVSSWLAVSVGALFTKDTRFHATATGGTLYGIDLDAYNPQPGDLDATVSFKSWSPYVGMTFGNRRPARGGVAFFGELGLVRSQPRFSFDEPYNPLLIPALVEAKEIEINRGMISQDGWWPVVKVGVAYGF